jgi:hypothetical protein
MKISARNILKGKIVDVDVSWSFAGGVISPSRKTTLDPNLRRRTLQRGIPARP